MNGLSSLLERAQHLETESTSSEGTDGYVTPYEFSEEEDAALTRTQDEEMREALNEASELKAEGTECFRAEKWVEALQVYTQALSKLPQRRDSIKPEKGKGKVQDHPIEDEAQDSREEKHIATGDEVPEVPPMSVLEQECAKARSVLNGNIGACHVKLEEHKEAVAACTQALLDDPQYVKALHRRAVSNETLATWSSLAAAEEDLVANARCTRLDYNSLIKLLPASSPLLGQARLAIQRIKPRREEAQKAEMGEMMDKLKGLGNSLLGNFGLSTDNFKFEPNGQGGYSINFVR